jgi:hypothetical protein
MKCFDFFKLSLFGRMNIYWKKVEGGATSEFAEIEDYIDESINVWIPNPKKKDEQWMFEGTHQYPFSYSLPVDLPETMEDSRYATVTYKVKGTVFMTLGRTSVSMDETFYLTALPDPTVPKPAEEDLPKVYLKDFSYQIAPKQPFLPASQDAGNRITHVPVFMSPFVEFM